MAAGYRNAPRKGYIAILVSTTLGYGIARMIDAYADTFMHVQVFHNSETAIDWITGSRDSDSGT